MMTNWNNAKENIKKDIKESISYHNDKYVLTYNESHD